VNDFTKDELDIVRTALSILETKWVPINQYKKRLWKLQNKIQSMIDSYCEHVPHDGEYAFPVCRKCHEVIY
jgi:hypothetical protein